ncbi:VOC family protein [Streptomyces sp. NPDC097619]|uniref:VOC family protein n=1 Tax=Streptomyces sp. NPDC097619 TaxID=3157228 RepID=UPI0033278565
MSAIKKVQVTFDCAEPGRVARFWCEVLGYVSPPPSGFDTWEAYEESRPAADRDSWSAASDPTGAGPRLYFQRVPEGKTAKNRVHLDVRAGTGLVGAERLAVLEAEAARLVALGASVVLVQHADEENESCITLQDVEGNEFCLD